MQDIEGGTWRCRAAGDGGVLTMEEASELLVDDRVAVAEETEGLLITELLMSLGGALGSYLMQGADVNAVERIC